MKKKFCVFLDYVDQKVNIEGLCFELAIFVSFVSLVFVFSHFFLFPGRHGSSLPQSWLEPVQNHS